MQVVIQSFPRTELLRMQQYFLVPDIELEPQVYVHVTTNWIGLTMRYVVDPKKRRAASTYLYRAIFDEAMERDDIEIGTDTMEITYKKAPSSRTDRRKEKATPSLPVTQAARPKQTEATKDNEAA